MTTNDALKTTLGFVLCGIAGLWAATTNEVSMPALTVMMVIAISGLALLLGAVARAGGRTLIEGVAAVIFAASAYLTFTTGGSSLTVAILALGAAWLAISVVMAVMRRAS